MDWADKLLAEATDARARFQEMLDQFDDGSAEPSFLIRQTRKIVTDIDTQIAQIRNYMASR